MPPTTALVRRPSPRLTEGLVTHVERRRSTSTGHSPSGTSTSTPSPRTDGPWSRCRRPTTAPTGCSSRTQSSCSGDVAVITRPGADRASRRSSLEPVIAVARLLASNASTAPATLDGGDVLKVGRPVYVGRGGRTNEEGIRQLRAILEPLRRHGRGRAAHQGAAPEVRGDRTARRHHHRLAAAGRRSAVFASFLAVPEESGAHVVLLDDDRLLMAADAPAARSCSATVATTRCWSTSASS